MRRDARPGTVLEGERLRRSGGGGGCPRAAPSAPAVPSRPGQAAPPGAAARGDGPGGHRRRETARRAGVSAGARHRLPPPLPPPSIPATSGPPGGGEPRGGGGERAAGFWRETGAVGAGKPAEPLGGLTPIAGPRRPPSPRPGPGGPRLPAAPALRTGAWRGGRLVATPPPAPDPCGAPAPARAAARPPAVGVSPAEGGCPGWGGGGVCVPVCEGAVPAAATPLPPPPRFWREPRSQQGGSAGEGGPRSCPAPCPLTRPLRTPRPCGGGGQAAARPLLEGARAAAVSVPPSPASAAAPRGWPRRPPSRPGSARRGAVSAGRRLPALCKLARNRRGGSAGGGGRPGTAHPGRCGGPAAKSSRRETLHRQNVCLCGCLVGAGCRGTVWGVS